MVHVEKNSNISERLLCQWQRDLELYLFRFCRINAPTVIAECAAPCPEAAELTRLSEKITEQYCYHRKREFEATGFSVQERERFCIELQEIRQLRNAAVHRRPTNATTMKRYGDSVLDILRIIRGLGGKRFEEENGESLDRLIHRFWYVDDDPHAIVSLQTASHSGDEQGLPGALSMEEWKRNNIQRAMEERKSAEHRRTINIGKTLEDTRLAQQKRAFNRQSVQLQEEKAVMAKGERAQKVKDQEEKQQLLKQKERKRSKTRKKKQQLLKQKERKRLKTRKKKQQLLKQKERKRLKIRKKRLYGKG